MAKRIDSTKPPVSEVNVLALRSDLVERRKIQERLARYKHARLDPPVKEALDDLELYTRVAVAISQKMREGLEYLLGSTDPSTWIE